MLAMACPRAPKRSQNGRSQDKLSSLSREVLKLRLQALSLPITGSKQQLISRLTEAIRNPPPRADRAASSRVRKASKRPRRASQPEREQITETSDVESPEELAVDESDDGASSIGGLVVDNTPTPASLFTDDQLRVLQHTVELSVEQALRGTRGQASDSTVLQTPSVFPRPAGTATPLGLHRPLDRSLEDKILRVPTTAKRTAQLLTHPAVQLEAPVHFAASTSISPVVVPGDPASSHMFAADAARPPTLCSSAPLVRPNQATIGPRSPATVSRSRVIQRSHNQQPAVSTPINVEELNRELCSHPDRNFVDSLISALRHGTHIGYTGPQSPRVSRNLTESNKSVTAFFSLLPRKRLLLCAVFQRQRVYIEYKYLILSALSFWSSSVYNVTDISLQDGKISQWH